MVKSVEGKEIRKSNEDLYGCTRIKCLYSNNQLIISYKFRQLIKNILNYVHLFKKIAINTTTQITNCKLRSQR